MNMLMRNIVFPNVVAYNFMLLAGIMTGSKMLAVGACLLSYLLAWGVGRRIWPD